MSGIDGKLAGCSVLMLGETPFVTHYLCDVLSTAGARVIGPTADLDQDCYLPGDGPGHAEAAVIDLAMGPAHALRLRDRLAEARIPSC